MTSKVIEGHKRYFLCLKINFFLNIFFVQHLIFTKFCMNDYIIKTFFFHNMMFDLKGKKISRGNSCSPSLSSPLLLLLSLYASLSFLSLLFLFSLSLFSTPPSPLHRPYIHPMPLYLFSLCCSSPLFLFFSIPPTPTSALNPPYDSLSFLSPFFLLSFFNLNLRSYGQLLVLVYLYIGFKLRIIIIIIRSTHGRGADLPFF